MTGNHNIQIDSRGSLVIACLVKKAVHTIPAQLINLNNCFLSLLWREPKVDVRSVSQI